MGARVWGWVFLGLWKCLHSFCLFAFLFSFLRQGISVLSWNSLDEAGLKLRDVCLCLSSARIKGVCHDHPTGAYSLVWLWTSVS